MLIIYGFPNLLYQEYVEPLILIIFFLALKTNLQKIYFNNISLSNFIFLSYFLIYLIGSIYFKHFAFDSYENGKFFLIPVDLIKNYFDLLNKFFIIEYVSQ